MPLREELFFKGIGKDGRCQILLAEDGSDDIELTLRAFEKQACQRSRRYQGRRGGEEE